QRSTDAPARGRPQPVAAQKCPDRGGRDSEAGLPQFPLKPPTGSYAPCYLVRRDFHRGFLRANLRVSARVAAAREGPPGRATDIAEPDELAGPAKLGHSNPRRRSASRSPPLAAAVAASHRCALHSTPHWEGAEG